MEGISEEKEGSIPEDPEPDVPYSLSSKLNEPKFREARSPGALMKKSNLFEYLQQLNTKPPSARKAQGHYLIPPERIKNGRPMPEKKL